MTSLKTKIIRGLKTGWMEEGETHPERPLLFFIHGFPDSPEVWRQQLQYFSKSYQVVAPFLRGSGPSEFSSQSSRYDMDSVLLDHLAILHEVAPNHQQRVCVIGHDIGGIHAWHLARALGDRLSHLVLLNAPELQQMVKKLANLPQLIRSWYLGIFVLPKIPEFLLSHWGKRLLAGIPDADLESAPHLLGHYRQALKVSLNWRPPEKALQAPVLVLWGKNDPYLLPPSVPEIDQLATHSTIRILDTGHWPQLQQTEKVNSLIASFLEKKI